MVSGGWHAAIQFAPRR